MVQLRRLIVLSPDCTGGGNVPGPGVASDLTLAEEQLHGLGGLGEGGEVEGGLAPPVLRPHAGPRLQQVLHAVSIA